MSDECFSDWSRLGRGGGCERFCEAESEAAGIKRRETFRGGGKREWISNVYLHLLISINLFSGAEFLWVRIVIFLHSQYLYLMHLQSKPIPLASQKDFLSDFERTDAVAIKEHDGLGRGGRGEEWKRKEEG